ncbi:MAG TPA: FAD-dependent oxidoreductase [Pyrinomonadaceae bacterium]|jgi:sulfide:quinone oxidoreductase
MARILIVGGGFGGVVAAESLAKKLGDEHQITLVSRSRDFIFYPALVRLAFGKCELDDISFDLREAMLDRRVSFVESEVARVNAHQCNVIVSGGEFSGEIPYDFLVIALGRRLATERIAGFYEYSHHLLGPDDALKFHQAVRDFHQGRAVIGSCPGARLPVPVFETAFAFSHFLEERGERSHCAITIVSDETPDEMFRATLSQELLDSLNSREIEFVSDFPIDHLTPHSIVASDGHAIECDLRLLIPPFRGPAPVLYTGLTDAEGYVRVDTTMKVFGAERIYAVGDCTSFSGPKTGHMAVRQGEVAAENILANIRGLEATATYDHELMLVIEADGADSMFVRKDLWTDEPAVIKQGRFWGWAKRGQEHYWKTRHA